MCLLIIYVNKQKTHVNFFDLSQKSIRLTAGAHLYQIALKNHSFLFVFFKKHAKNKFTAFKNEAHNKPCSAKDQHSESPTTI